jgi:hypothetical protein|tara:strand:- start:574 stop:678 length:105 start_codon:yes stop_codon:yes gene_type:complete
MKTEVQKSGIRKTVTVLVIFVAAVFAWSIVKYLL